MPKLDAVLVLFNREFVPKDRIIDSILSTMKARGFPYRHWMDDATKFSSLIVSDAENPARYMSTALVQFRIMLEGHADLRSVEVAPFEGTEGIRGVVLSHWS